MQMNRRMRNGTAHATAIPTYSPTDRSASLSSRVEDAFIGVIFAANETEISKDSMAKVTRRDIVLTSESAIMTWDFL